MKNVFLLLGVLLLCIKGIGQNSYELKGKIIDENQEALSWSSIRLQNPTDSSLIDNSYSNDKGQFVLNSNQPNVLLVISYVGYNEYEKLITLTDSKTDLGQIQLTQGVNLTKVEVKARRSKFAYKNGKVIAKVDSESTDTGVEVLRTLPMIFLDRNDNLSIRGRAATVLINGSDLKLQGEELKAYLETLNASEIKEIEVITNPDASYDANFNNGIINIVLRKNISKTYTTLYARAGYGDFHKLRSGAQFGVAKDNMSWLTTVNYSNSETQNRLSVDRENSDPENPFTLRQRSTWNPVSNYLSARSSFKYDLGDQLAFYTFVKYSRSDEDALSQTTSQLNSNINSTFESNEENLWNRLYAGSKIDYQIDTFGSNLSLEYLHTRADNDVFSSDFSETALPGTENTDVLAFDNNSVYDYRINSVELDYYKPIGEASLRAGLKYANIGIDNQILNEFIQLDEPLNYNLPQSSEFIENEDIYAAYVSFGHQFGQLSYEAGLRVEHSTMDIESIQDERILNNQQTFFNFFPNLGLTYKLAERQVLSLTYSRRINRPNYADLNPVIKLIDQYSYTQGNPFLIPEFSHNLDIGYKTGPVLLTLYGNVNRNAVDDFLFQSEENSASVLTKTNFVRSRSAGLSANTSIPVGKKIEFYLYGLYAYNEANFKDNETVFNNNTWFGRLSLYATYYVNDKIKFDLSGFYVTPRISGVYELRSTYAMDASVRYQINSLTMSLSMRDIFQTARWDSVINQNDLRAEWNNRWERGIVSLSIRYRFGANVKASDYGRRINSDEANRVSN